MVVFDGSRSSLAGGHAVPIGLAARRGLLQRDLRGLGVSFPSIQSSGDRAKIASHFTHALPDSVRHGGNTPAIFARASGADTRVVALSWTPTPHPILALPRPDGRLATGGDLRREEVFALIRGEVDAIYSQSSFAAEVVAFTGAEVVYDIGRHPDALEQANNALPEAFTVSSSLIEREFEAVALVLAHAIASSVRAKSHKREAVRIIAFEQRVSEETLEVAYGPDIHLHLDIDLSPFRREALAARKQFLLRQGFISAAFDLDAWIDPRPLERAREIVADWRPEAETAAAVA